MKPQYCTELTQPLLNYGIHSLFSQSSLTRQFEFAVPNRPESPVELNHFLFWQFTHQYRIPFGPAVSQD